MFELNEEETLMTSSDHSVKLTTHRIIHESGGRREQVMLEDLQDYQLMDRSLGAYGALLLFFIVLTSVILSNIIQQFYDRRHFLKHSGVNEGSLLNALFHDAGAMILLGILIVLHIFYMISRRYMIRIVGKYNSFEFRVKSFRNKSVRRMLDTMTRQSKLMKEKAGIDKPKPIE